MSRDAAAEAALLAQVAEAFDEAGDDLERAISDVSRLVGTWFDDLAFVRLVDDIPDLTLVAAWDREEATAARFSNSVDANSEQLTEVRDDYTALLDAPIAIFGELFELLLENGDESIVGPLREVGSSGGIVAPLRVGGRSTGVLGLLCKRHGGDHGEDDLRFMGDIADRIALAAENARLVARLRDELERRTHAERRHVALLEQGSDVILVLASDGEILDVTPAVTRVLRREPDDLIGRNVADIAHVDERPRVHRALVEIVRQDGPLPPLEYRVLTGDGGTVWLEAIANDLLDDPAVGGIVVTMRDITERHRAAELLATENRILASVAAGAALTPVLDEVCRLVEASCPGIAAIWRLEPERGLVFWAGPTMPEGVFDVEHPVMGGEVDAWAPLLVDRIEVADARTHPAWREWRDVASRYGVAGSWSRAIADPSGAVLGALVVYLTEVREPNVREAQVAELATQLAGVALDRDRASEAMTHAATHDALTGLPNRTLFLERLGLTLRDGDTVAVLFVDLDGFKHVNDSTGHAAGDDVLRQAAARLRDVVRPGDTIARLGGDEFAVLCEQVPAAEIAEQVAGRVLEVLRDPFVAADREFHLSASIGIAVSERGSTATSLLRDADAAMYRAKATGRGRHCVFTPEVREANVVRHTVESELRLAIERDELDVWYQPIVHLQARRLVGLEALVRWNHPTRGVVSPADFVPVAEEAGFIVAIGELVLHQACAAIAGWMADGTVTDDVHLAVNVSMAQLVDPGLPQLVDDVLACSGFPGGRLDLEVTETAAAEDPEKTAERIGVLHQRGVCFAIDDFGTGHSSLSRLRTLDVDTLKLDRSFVVDVDADPSAEEVVASVIRLAHALGKSLVIEGVERAAELEVVRRLGADAAQGYHLARPMPAAELVRFLAGDAAW